jgi:hypothetical protein
MAIFIIQVYIGGQLFLVLQPSTLMCLSCVHAYNFVMSNSYIKRSFFHVAMSLCTVGHVWCHM